MKTGEFYISKEFDNGNYMAEVKTNTRGGLMVVIYYKHMSGDWEFEDAILIDLSDIIEGDNE